MKPSSHHFVKLLALFLFSSACQSQTNNTQKKSTMNASNTAAKFTAGKDYVEFSRVKIMDKQVSAEPVEAYSIMLPKGWSADGGVFWTPAGNTCAGTNMQFSGKSPEGKSSFFIYPNIMWSWSSNQQSNQFSSQQATPYCGVGEPLDATQYLKNVWSREMNNPSISDIKSNPDVVQSMRQNDERGRAELMRYGAGQVNFRHTAITARLKWNNDTAGIVMCSVTNIETYIPNVYTGGYDVSYTSAATRMLFLFPQSNAGLEEKMMSVIVAGFRTNPIWKETTDNYWRSVREKKHVQHLGTIRVMDERTAQIGKQAIANGNKRLSEMDTQLRSWEAQQSSQDRMHTNFIKTIREVEHYRDDNGKVELSAGYNHAWSRGDGVNYVMTNSPNVDPSSIFQDQRWKEMKKVD
ncbi:hypothetical protein LZZ85_05695 [Terrimonas sp. NA20]|uniref:Uncharacterized protein n=1 Tax=Terrimonas ginsenosidimutans TaxID=2908004 RepID=A0ABS9KN58_9BACT|nr:hypothetical protein [Terrimonas ginsenosidimutans]MCG2613761.1 hypothetical protein [Terrimonas ginsenosidimutans]